MPVAYVNVWVVCQAADLTSIHPPLLSTGLQNRCWIKGKRKKKRAKKKYFRPKTDINLDTSLDVQKSTIYENRLAKRPPKWSQKGRPKWRQKSIKKRYPKSSSLKPPGFVHCRQKGISTELPEHTHLFQDISRFQARVEYTRTASRGTSSLASRPTGRHQQF